MIKDRPNEMVYLEIITATGNLYMSSISLKKTSPLK
jgi:hypothetical protein